jgi:hypothetical protein
MALLYIDGFDHQNNTTDLIANFGPFEWRAQSAVAFVAGRYGGRAINLGSYGTLTGVLTASLAEAFIGYALYLPATIPHQLVVWDSALQSASTPQVTINFDNNNGVISVYRGTSTLLGATGNNAFTSAAWFYFEADIKISATVGVVNIMINGVSVLNLTGLNTQAGTNSTFDTVQPYAAVGNNNASAIDDFYICDTTTSSFNTFVGPTRVFTAFPVAASGSPQYTPAASTNVSQVQETAMDSDTTYNYDATVGHKDLFTITTMPTGLVPIALQVTGAYRQDSAGTRAMASQILSNATELAGTSNVLNGIYTYQHDVYIVDPNGGIALTAANVNAMKIGYATTA